MADLGWDMHHPAAEAPARQPLKQELILHSLWFQAIFFGGVPHTAILTCGVPDHDTAVNTLSLDWELKHVLHWNVWQTCMAAINSIKAGPPLSAPHRWVPVFPAFRSACTLLCVCPGTIPMALSLLLGVSSLLTLSLLKKPPLPC